MAAASNANANGVGEEQAKDLTDQLNRTLKEGERLLAPTRRPDGTIRKPIKIRAGYVPQDEVAIYKSKGTLLKKEKESLEAVPPGYDPELNAKPKTKSTRRNERKKEKRLQQAALDNKEDSSTEGDQALESVDSVVSKINDLTVSVNSSFITPLASSTECSTPGDHVPDIDKKIRALKKKIRLTEAQQQKSVQEMKPEQLDKMSKLEDWRRELKLLEQQKTALGAV